MPATNDYKINADRCAELARAATKEADRKVWLGMERYWLGRLSQQSPNDDPPLIKSMFEVD
jgi:hypothetical protein